MESLIFQELNKFNDFKFDEPTHVYTRHGIKYKSVTGLIKDYSTPYDSEYWSIYKALQGNNIDVKSSRNKERIITFLKRNKDVHISKIPDSLFKTVTPKNILFNWSIKSQRSTYLGSSIHNFIENWYKKKTYTPDATNKENTLVFADIKDDYEKLQNQFIKFYNETKNLLIPIYSEFVVGDMTGSYISGMIDQLFWNVKYNCIQIWDWKTNGEIKTENRWQNLLSIFRDLPDCDYSKYSVQLNMYRAIIEANTKLKLGDSYFVNYNINNQEYKLYKTLDLQKECLSTLEFNAMI